MPKHIFSSDQKIGLAFSQPSRF